MKYTDRERSTNLREPAMPRAAVWMIGFLVLGLLPLARVSAQSAPPLPANLWEDVTASTIGSTAEWTNKVELADINGDGLVDILFANGGNYQSAGDPVASRVFANNGLGKMFTEVTDSVFGSAKMLARVIKVRDVNGDSNPDIIVGTTYVTQSRLYLGDGHGKFTDATATHLPQLPASVGDLELGDVDADGDLDMVLVDWGADMAVGGRTMLWLNDDTGHFSDVTAAQMPDIKVQFSWELEFVDVDNDYDLDIAISCKTCAGSFLFRNDGSGHFSDDTQGNLPQFTNNYDFEPMDLDGDGYLDLVTINDGDRATGEQVDVTERVFRNNQHGGYDDATDQWWPPGKDNPNSDDNMEAFLDFDSDGDADFLIGSLDGADRLMINDGTGHLTAAKKVFKTKKKSEGTLGIALSDLNGDHKLDVVEAQGETDGSIDERVYFGSGLQSDTASPVITLVESAPAAKSGQSVQIRARVHDNKSPTMPQDWQSVTLRWSADGKTGESPMVWYGEYLWRGTISALPAGTIRYQVCATDKAGNAACSDEQSFSVS